MSYDVDIVRVLYGDARGRSLRFCSPGWIGYAKYGLGERVLLFLIPSSAFADVPWGLARVADGQAICYISGDDVDGPPGTRTLNEYLRLVEESAR